MRSDFNTLYPEDSTCSNKCHMREHQNRITNLELALEALQRSIKKKQNKTSSCEEDKTSPNPCGVNLEELKSSLKLKKNCSEGINFLLLKLFSIEELTTSSVMGVGTKKGQKKKDSKKKKRTIIEGLIAETFEGVTITAIHNIMRDRLKLLRKRHFIQEEKE
ncbi:uncharacterized protein LOC125664612 [Ostrea edulis]|uniref:uncharacterized protein LOC125664612 n=1 Tax=Ostrea edulis TaxID=37623 RepID=UPI0024AF830A|nr:uncharacterized protein LOC125664612 [Ostrea edulis]